MKLFDCHNHIQDERIYPELENVMVRARLAGVEKMAIKGCCESDWPKVVEIINRHSNAYLAFGLHPWFIDGRSDQCFKVLEDLLTSYPQASVGEIGIDHAIDSRNDADQEHVFLLQLELARKLDRPVSIHCRKAWGRLIELLDEFGELPRGMLIHCFGGSAEIAIELVKRGAYISFSGSITRPNARKAGPAIRAVPDDRILIETDAPDILPHNVDEASCLVADDRLLNEPAHLPLVLAKAAELRGTSEENLAALTYRNAERFFRRTGFQPVTPERDGSTVPEQDGGAAPEQDGGAAHGQDAHATENCRTGFQPVIPERDGSAVPEQDGGAAHGQDAHATENCRTGFQPVIPERDGSAVPEQDGGTVPEQDGSAAHGQDAHATENCRTGFQPVIPERDGSAVPEQDGGAAHGQDAHATENCRTGFQPVIPERDGSTVPEQDGGAVPEQDGGAAHGQDAHATASGLPENYTVGNQLEEFYIRHGAHLPHWTRKGGVYAVTFRLGDSLPQSVLISWKTERTNIIRNAEQQKRPLSAEEENRLRKLYAEKVDSYLDSGKGECWLESNAAAQMMKDTLFHFDGERYSLLAWCVMPNHVHVVFHPLEGFDVSGILHTWKSYSATQANRMLKRKGGFWQTEYYDHLIRDEADFRHAVEYVLSNPMKAGLKNWPWCGAK